MAEEQAAWRRNWKPDVSACPWIPLVIDGKHYWIKHHIVTDNVTVFVFDGVHVWGESSNDDDVKYKIKLYNPNVEVPVNKVFQHLKECLQYNSTKGQFHVQQKDRGDTLTLQVTSHLAGGVPFKWKFELQMKNKKTSSEEVTFPLMCMVSELIQREQALVTLLKRKDSEIDDMKAAGAKVSRKYLETNPFNHKGFQQQRYQSKGFEEIVTKRGSDCFKEDGQSIYKEIMVTSAWVNRPQQAETQDVVADTVPLDEGPNASPSWANKVPPSMLTNSPSPAGSKNSSPRKSFSPGKLEEKQTELLRREALERKLEEEKQRQLAKPKKKKKKLF